MRRVLTLLAVLLISAPAIPAYGSRSEDEPKKLFTIEDERITESSGLARSRKHKGIWWTVNDSSDSARVFGVDRTGKVVAELTFGADVRDVEALAVGSDGKIYVADIGDNLEDQKKVRVFAISEPEDLEDNKMKYRAYDFEYPDGPHNAEAILVHPGTNRIYLVTKESRGGIYAGPEQASRDGVNELTRVGDAPATITDGTFTPDGKRVLLRNYTTMFVMTWPKPAKAASITLPVVRQGESLAMGQTNGTVVVGSEGENSPVYEVTIPTKKGGSTPTPTPAAAGSSGGNGKSHTTRWLLIGAGAFAVIIALMTFPAGRRERLDAMLEQERLRGPGQRRRSMT